MPPNNIIGYNGNPNLVVARQPIVYTQFQIDELKKCIDDPVYFTLNYMKIVHVDHGLIPFTMWGFQTDLLNKFHNNRFNIVLASRQIGKTSTTVAYLLHQILFRDNVNVALLANKGQTAREILGRLQLAYEYLPKWMQQGILVWNKGNIELQNGSKILAASTSSSAIRGGSYNIIFLDEFAFVHNNQAEQFFRSVYPTISSGNTTKVIIVSTPNGLNMFYRMWKNAVEKRSLYVPTMVLWDQVPGRDAKWKEETIRNTSQEQWDQEFSCSFLGNSHTLISSVKLKTLVESNPLPQSKMYGFDILELPVNPGYRDKFTKRDYVPGNIYALMVDVSRGQGQDYSAFSIIDITSFPYKQVATYRDNTISPLVFPTIIFNAAKLYNDAYVLVEISDIGQQVADILHFELEYENLVKVTVKGKQGQLVSSGHTKKIQFGVKTSTATKRIGCANLKTMIENDKLIVNDMNTILELMTFTAQKESFRAEEGNHDDLVMTLVLFGWFIAQRNFKQNLTGDIRKVLQEEQLNLTDEEISPIVIDDGIDEEIDDLADKFMKTPIDSAEGTDKPATKEQLDEWVAGRKKQYPLDSHDYDWLHQLRNR